MASEIRVDKINSLSGVGTVTLSPTGVDIAGITTVATLKATTGIVTTLTATTGIVTTFEATTGNITTLRTPTGISTHFTADKISLPDSSDGSLCIGIGSDLKFNHNGGHSYITEVGTGNLYIQGSNIIVRDAGTLDKHIEMTQNGAVELFHDNSKKLETTSDGVTLTGDLSIDDKIVHTGDTNTAIRFPAADTITAETGGSERVRIDSSGRVGLGGQTSPSATIHIQDLSANGYELKLGGNAITFNRASLSYIDQINDTGSLVFRTTSSQTNALTIASNGNITANAGNLVIGTSGKGIDFSATSDASGASSEVFDDYEEGEYTPTITLGSGSVSLNSSYDKIRYTKIGRQVTLTGQLVFNAHSSGGGTLNISLPFANGNGTDRSEYVLAAGVGYFNPSGSSSPTGDIQSIGFLITAGSSNATVYGLHPNYDTTTGNWVGNGSDIWFNLTYFTDS